MEVLDAASSSRPANKVRKVIMDQTNQVRTWKTEVVQEWHRSVQEQGMWMMLLKFFVPWWIAIIAVFVIGVGLPRYSARLLFLFGFYFLTPLGMEIGVPTGIGLGIPPLMVVLFILFVDGVTAMFLIWNLGYAKLIPYLGGLLIAAEKKGEELFKKYTWVDRLAFVGLALFVMIPIAGTGAIIGSIVGRIMGMNPYKMLLAILVGSGLRVTSLAYFAHGVFEFVTLFEDPYKQALIVLSLFAILLGVYNIYLYRKARGQSIGIGMVKI